MATSGRHEKLESDSEMNPSSTCWICGQVSNIPYLGVCFCHHGITEQDREDMKRFLSLQPAETAARNNPELAYKFMEILERVARVEGFPLIADTYKEMKAVYIAKALMKSCGMGR